MCVVRRGALIQVRARGGSKGEANFNGVPKMQPTRMRRKPPRAASFQLAIWEVSPGCWEPVSARVMGPVSGTQGG